MVYVKIYTHQMVILALKDWRLCILKANWALIVASKICWVGRIHDYELLTIGISISR